MTPDKLLILTLVIAAIMLALGYYRIEQNIYGEGIVVKDDINELQGQMR